MNVLAIHARMGQPAKTKLMHIRVPVHMVRKTWQSLAKKISLYYCWRNRSINIDKAVYLYCYTIIKRTH